MRIAFAPGIPPCAPLIPREIGTCLGYTACRIFFPAPRTTFSAGQKNTLGILCGSDIAAEKNEAGDSEKLGCPR